MIKVIMDCDPGHDDAIALLLASRSENIKILGVTTVAGNSELENTTRNARENLLDFIAGVADVDVYAGCSKPLMRGSVSPDRCDYSRRRWTWRAQNPGSGDARWKEEHRSRFYYSYVT